MRLNIMPKLFLYYSQNPITAEVVHSDIISPIHSTSLEISEVSSETAILWISVPQQTDTSIFFSAL